MLEPTELPLEDRLSLSRVSVANSGVLGTVGGWTEGAISGEGKAGIGRDLCTNSVRRFSAISANSSAFFWSSN